MEPWKTKNPLIENLYLENHEAMKLNQDNLKSEAKQTTHMRRRQNAFKSINRLLVIECYKIYRRNPLFQKNEIINKDALHEGQKQSDQYLFTRWTQIILKIKCLHADKQTIWGRHCNEHNLNKTPKIFTSKTIKNPILFESRDLKPNNVPEIGVKTHNQRTSSRNMPNIINMLSLH